MLNSVLTTLDDIVVMVLRPEDYDEIAAEKGSHWPDHQPGTVNFLPLSRAKQSIPKKSVESASESNLAKSIADDVCAFQSYKRELEVIAATDVLSNASPDQRKAMRNAFFSGASIAYLLFLASSKRQADPKVAHSLERCMMTEMISAGMNCLAR